MNIYGYARVSTKDQNLARQFSAFYEFGIEEKNIYADKKSGKDFERIQYKRLMKKLKSGDLLVIKSIDRLGRNYEQIIAEWSHITSTIGADILVLDIPLLDTRTRAETLVGKFISNIVLQLLSFVAHNERDMLKQRQADGIAAAKLRGIKFGRPKRVYDQEFIEISTDYVNNKISLTLALDKLSISKANFFYHLRHIKQLQVINSHNPTS